MIVCERGVALKPAGVGDRRDPEACAGFEDLVMRGETIMRSVWVVCIHLLPNHPSETSN